MNNRFVFKASLRNKWWIILVVLWVILAALLISFIVSSTAALQIEDLNGVKNTSLATLTLEDVVERHSHTSFASSTRNGGSGSNVTGAMKEYDWQTSRFSCKKISGVKVLQATRTDQDSLTLTVSSKILSGNMEMIVTIDGEYYCHVASGCTEVITLEGIAGKTVLVKLAAESAQVDVTVTRKIG